MPRSHKSGADGVVSSAGLRRRAELTTPSATNRNGSIVFDVADTPPLRGGECAAPKTLSKKTKSCSLVTRDHHKAQVSCALWFVLVLFVYLPRFASFWPVRRPRNLRDRGRSDSRTDFCLHVAFDGRLRRAAPFFPPNDGDLSAGLTLLVVEHG